MRTFPVSVGCDERRRQQRNPHISRHFHASDGKSASTESLKDLPPGGHLSAARSRRCALNHRLRSRSRIPNRQSCVKNGSASTGDGPAFSAARARVAKNAANNARVNNIAASCHRAGFGWRRQAWRFPQGGQATPLYLRRQELQAARDTPCRTRPPLRSLCLAIARPRGRLKQTPTG